MKKLLFLIIFFSTLTKTYAQLPPWNTKFVVYHPDGFTDTLFIGCDENATDGYDEGLDIIDTSFHYPLAIRGYSEALENDSAFGTCVNLKKDVRGFGYPATFEFYILYDSIAVDENIYLGWDTTTLYFSVDTFKIEGAILYSSYGYIGGIDATSYFICSRDGADTGLLNIHDTPIPIFVEEYSFECSITSNILKLSLQVFFKDYSVDLQNFVAVEGINIYPSILQDLLFISNSLNQNCILNIINSSGQIIFEKEVAGLTTESMSFKSFPKGVYNANVLFYDNNIIYSQTIIKL